MAIQFATVRALVNKIAFMLFFGMLIFRCGNPPSLSVENNTQYETSVIERQDRQLMMTLLLALIPVVVAFSFIVFIFYRAKRESFFKQKEAELKLSLKENELHLKESELQTIRAQTNPHFIFNCLNSIHHCMQEDDVQRAKEYLIKFSQLIRHVLQTSSEEMVELAEELEALQNYIALEQLRMKNSFEAEILLQPEINAHEMAIPAMIIQPFIENSIWHGLSQRGEGGRMTITIAQKDELHIQCTIIDNGLDSAAKSAFDLSHLVKKTSMGLDLIRQRLDIINRLQNRNSGFEFHNVIDENGQRSGKKVILYLPFKS